MQSLIDSVNNEFNLEKNLLVGIFLEHTINLNHESRDQSRGQLN